MVPQDLGVGSHVPFLATAVARTHGVVLEFGTGWWSTPMLHYMCKGARTRPLISYETDPEWLKVMRQFEDENHLMLYVPNWDNIDIQYCASVAFVDCSMDTTQRKHHRPALVKRLKEAKCHFIVCHDTEADIRPAAGDYGWAQLDGLFKYQYTFQGIRPWTTVYSDFEEFAR